MTVGYLLDLFIINQVRKDELRDTIEADDRMDLNKQDGHLLKEIGKFLIEVIYKLYQRHKELWTLEDLRRDKNNSNKTRLDACDRVSIANKKRNDLVEMIDFIISRRLKESRQGRV
mgnify:CR=1 FL=1